jgi:hypothetical protein
MATPKRSPIERASIKSGGGDLRRKDQLSKPAQKGYLIKQIKNYKDNKVGSQVSHGFRQAWACLSKIS